MEFSVMVETFFAFRWYWIYTDFQWSQLGTDNMKKMLNQRQYLWL